MIRRKYAYMRIDDYNIAFADVENTITYLLSAKNLENNLNKREEELCNKISELEQELAELKEKAIVPRFKIGQEVWYVGYSSVQSWIVKSIELKYIKDELCEIYRLGHYGKDDYSCCIMPFDSDRYFATEQEAQDKLKEIQGNE